jgi:hypothetical protein
MTEHQHFEIPAQVRRVPADVLLGHGGPQEKPRQAIVVPGQGVIPAGGGVVIKNTLWRDVLAACIVVTRA